MYWANIAASSAWPACGTLVLLTAQLAGLVEGLDYLQESQAQAQLAWRAGGRSAGLLPRRPAPMGVAGLTREVPPGMLHLQAPAPPPPPQCPCLLCAPRAVAASRQALQEQGGSSSRLVAPPLLEAYAALLVELLPAVQAEEAANAAQGFPGVPSLVALGCVEHRSAAWQAAQLWPGLGRPLPSCCWTTISPCYHHCPACRHHCLAVRMPRNQQRQQMLCALGAAMVAQLMRLPPPLQHMLGPGCVSLLRLEAAAGGSRQCAALLWMLARQQLGGVGGGSTGAVRLPVDSPDWLQDEAPWLQADKEGPSHGHVLLLRPLRQVQQAAAAEMLGLLRQHLSVELGGEAAGGEAAGQAAAGLSADELLPAADACSAAIQVLLLEQQLRQQQEQKQQQAQQRQGGDSGAEDSEAEGEEAQQQESLLLSSAAAVLELGALAAALCQAGAAAAREVAAAVNAAAAAPRSTRQRSDDGSEGFAAVEAAASAVALCNQLVEPADCLLQAGFLPPAAAQQLDAACEALDGQLRAIEQLERLLPLGHPLLAAVGAAMQAAPRLWQPRDDQSSEEEEGSDGGETQRHAGGSRQRHHGGGKAGRGGGGSKAAQSESRRRRRRRIGDVRNPALRAMLAEEGGGAALDAGSWGHGG